ncbi:MAG TPA: methionyl-tRNA formyltransferase [Candidatus Paceibacterota bacterium]|nr:methionyl-tRNA formyltransferase [Candidatus Paceibacterota bacterium]
MKYVFFGSPRFATIVLIRLLDAGFTPAALVCNPDRPVGRKQVITPPPTKEVMLGRLQTAPIIQPEKITAGFANEIQVLNPDFFVVAAYASIIPEAVLAIPRLGTLGVHPSLLPKYRGATPIQSAILNGETETGSTIFIMDSKVDHGAIIAQDKLSIGPDETYDSLEMRLATLSGGLLVDAIPQFMDGKLTPQPQDDLQATFTKKFETIDGFIDERDLAQAESGDAVAATTIHRKIRALNPEPGCWTMRGMKRVKLLEATLANGVFRLKTIQEEGGVPKPAA